MPKHKKIDFQIFSEAFPPNKKGRREKQDISSSSHMLLKDTKLDPNNIIYKPLTKQDIEETKNLHKEWFPIKYSDEYFNTIFNSKEGKYFSIGAFYNIINEETKEKKEIIIGLALCEWIIGSDYFFKVFGKESALEISKNINYIEEVYSYLKYDDYHCIYIMTIGVLDEFRKMKIGGNIVERIINIGLSDKLCIGIFLDVIYYNYSAIKFYKRNEFKKVKTNKNYYNLNGTKYDAHVFLRIFSRKEKDRFRYKNSNVIKKSIDMLLNPIFFIFKIIIFIIFLQCFRNKIKLK
jgi:RimJ/RimL family protein N-acetyltransferase